MENESIALAMRKEGWASAAYQWLELILFASLLPTLMAHVDSMVLRHCQATYWHWKVVGSAYLLFVGQTAVLSTLLGWRLRHTFLKWIVLVWALLLVDFLAFTVAMSGSQDAICLCYALLSGQIGMLVVWGILGTAPWVLRYPAAIAGLVVVTRFSLALRDEYWFPILTWQGMATASFVSVVWFFGFRLKPASAMREMEYRSMQITMRHLFLWTTVVACVVGAARVVDWVSLFYTEHVPLFPVVALAACFSLISMISVWAALGAERPMIRLFVLVLFPPLVALAVGLVGLSLDGATRQGGWAASHLRIGNDFDPQRWMVWMYLVSFFLGATLLMFRTSGYRLVRERR